MKIVRKINSLFIVLFLVVLMFVFNVFTSVSAATNSFTNEGATYTFLEQVETKNIGYGITYSRDLATVTTHTKGYAAGAAAGSDGGGDLLIGEAYKNQVNLLEISPSTDIEIVPYAVLEGGNWCVSTVRDAAKYYEDSHPGYKVVAAINGDYFRISDDCKASTGVTVGQGEFYKTSSSHGGVNTLAIKNDGEGKQLFTVTENATYPTLTIYDKDGNEIKKVFMDKVNQVPGDGETALYYATRDINYAAAMTNVKVSNAWLVNKPIAAVTTMKDSFYGKGEISEFKSEEFELEHSKFAVVSNNAEINELLATGVTIRCQYEYKNESLQNINSFLGFPFKIMENGQALNNDNYRHPRTMIGQKEDGTMVMAVIDGRQRSKDFYGATCMEMAATMAYYGCVDVWNLDGGGSSTLLIRKQTGWEISSAFKDTASSSWYVTNSPSDNSERRDGNCLLIVAKVPVVELKVADVSDTFIKINVAMLTTIEKYKELYIMLNNEAYPVEDGIATIPGLVYNTDYIGYLYAKVDGEFVNLINEISFKTAHLRPTSISAEATLKERNDELVIQIRYYIDNTGGVQTTGFEIAGEKKPTSSNVIFVKRSSELFDALYEFDVYIIAKLSSYLQAETIIFEDIELTYDLMTALSEGEVRNNDIMKDIFNIS